MVQNKILSIKIKIDRYFFNFSIFCNSDSNKDGFYVGEKLLNFKLY